MVALQGADETYERWAEVERFVVPRTLFSEYDHELEQDTESNTLSRESTSKPLDVEVAPKDSLSSVASNSTGSMSPSSLKSVRSSLSPVSPPTSPAKTVPTPQQNMTSTAASGSRPQSTGSSVPPQLQPLFNYILWRIHQETDPIAALESFIFLCNDHSKVHCAKGFDIKTKRLEQLREAVGREDRDFKNRMALLNRENQNLNPAATNQAAEQELEKDESEQEDSDDEERVVFKPSPPRAPAAMLHKQQSNVMDPNAFSRRPQPMPTSNKDQNVAPKSPRTHNPAPKRDSPRGNHAVPFTPRGAMRGNARGAARGSPRGRGNTGSTRGGFSNGSADKTAQAGQIDPDSFARPDPRGGFSGGRGSRKLWVPT